MFRACFASGAVRMQPSSRVLVLPRTSTDTPSASRGPMVISQWLHISSSRKVFSRAAFPAHLPSSMSCTTLIPVFRHRSRLARETPQHQPCSWGTGFGGARTKPASWWCSPSTAPWLYGGDSRTRTLRAPIRFLTATATFLNAPSWSICRITLLCPRLFR